MFLFDNMSYAPAVETPRRGMKNGWKILVGGLVLAVIYGSALYSGHQLL